MPSARSASTSVRGTDVQLFPDAVAVQAVLPNEGCSLGYGPGIAPSVVNLIR